MKRTRKLILALVVVLSLLMAMAVAIIPANAAGEQPEYLYFKANSNWKSDGARFAAYFFGNGERWVSMTSIGNDYYMVKVPTDKTFPKVIFARMNGSNNNNGWGNKWNQTGDLTIPTNGRNTFNAPSTCYDGYTGGWQTSAYTPTFTVAGTFNGWAAEADDTNKMTYTEDGIWKITIQINNGDHKYKVASGSWTASWPGSDKEFTTTYTKSNVTFTFDMNTTTVTETVACAHGGKTTTTTVDASCTVNGSTTVTCDECSETISQETITAPGHNHEACPHKAVVGDTYYETIEQAIAGAAAGSEIVLNSDIEVLGDLTIENQVTINLNGKTLTAGAVVTFYEGTKFIGEGKLEVAKNSLYNIKGETKYVPVWNAPVLGENDEVVTPGYYTFSEVKDQIKESTVEDTEVVVFRPAFENKEIKKEFVDGAGDNGLSFVIRITWEGLAKPKEYTLTDDFIANVYNAEKPKAIQLGFENWQAGVEYTVTLRIVSGGIYYETILCTMKDGAITVPKIVTE